MAKGTKIIAVILCVLVALYFIIRVFTPNVCSGVTRDEQSTIKLGLKRLNPRIEFDETINQNWQGFYDATLLTLSRMNIHCELLSSCMRFRIRTAPSEVCPTEYQDFLNVSESVAETATYIADIESGLTQYEKANSDLEEARASSSGATPGHLVGIQDRINYTRNILLQLLSDARSHASDSATILSDQES